MIDTRSGHHAQLVIFRIWPIVASSNQKVCDTALGLALDGCDVEIHTMGRYPWGTELRRSLCRHEHLGMDGICHRCGEDRRGI